MSDPKFTRWTNDDSGGFYSDDGDWIPAIEVDKHVAELEGRQIEVDYLFNIYSGFSKSKFIEMQARIDRLEAENTRLRILVDRTCGDGCHCMSENNGKCAALRAHVRYTGEQG